MAALDINRAHFGSLSSAGRIGLTFTSMFASNSATDISGPNVISLTLSERIGVTFASVAGSVRAWNDARITRNALNRLTNRELDDIGLVRGDIDAIARGDTIR